MYSPDAVISIASNPYMGFGYYSYPHKSHQCIFLIAQFIIQVASLYLVIAQFIIKVASLYLVIAQFIITDLKNDNINNLMF